MIAPYDLRMGQPGSIQPAALRRQAEQLHLVDQQQVIALAGAAYTAAVRQVWPHATTPLAPADSAANWPGWPKSPNPLPWQRHSSSAGADECRRRQLFAASRPAAAPRSPRIINRDSRPRLNKTCDLAIPIAE